MRFHTEPQTKWKNIFELWQDNGQQLPFKVAKSTWSAEAGHYLIVDEVKIKKWPYGAAWGRYHWQGVAGPREPVKAAGTYNWKLLDL